MLAYDRRDADSPIGDRSGPLIELRCRLGVIENVDLCGDVIFLDGRRQAVNQQVADKA